MLYFRRYCLTKTFAVKWEEWGLVWLDEHRRGYIGFLQTPPEKEDLEKVDWVCKGGVDVQISAYAWEFFPTIAHNIQNMSPTDDPLTIIMVGFVI